MKAVNRKSGLLVVLGMILLGCASHCFASSGDHIEVHGLVWSGGTWQKIWVPTKGWCYKFEVGKLRDLSTDTPGDDVEWYDDSNWCDECDAGDHVPGGSGICPEHAHILRGDFPTSSLGGPTITQGESEEFWEAVCLNEAVKSALELARQTGPSSYEIVDPLTDDEDDNAPYGSADIHYNCHGYAFDEDGHSDLCLWFGDGADGAGVVLGDDALLYEQATCGDDSFHIMYMGNHTNYVWNTTGWPCPQAKEIGFKYRHSQMFEYEYDFGRDCDEQFYGEDPEYYDD